MRIRQNGEKVQGQDGKGAKWQKGVKKMPKAKQYDRVVLLESVGDFSKDAWGAVVEVYTTPYEAYDIEIMTDDGRTIGLADAVRPEQFERTMIPLT